MARADNYHWMTQNRHMSFSSRRTDQPCGATTSRSSTSVLWPVWGYSRFGDVLVSLAGTFLLCPVLQYVDDYGSMEEETGATSSFSGFEILNGVLGFHMKTSKRQPPQPEHRTPGVLISSDRDKSYTLNPKPHDAVVPLQY